MELLGLFRRIEKNNIMGIKYLNKYYKLENE